MFNYEESITLIEKRIEERWGNMEFNASLDINSLADARSHFTALYAFLGEKMSTLYREHKLQERERKRAYIDAKIKYMDTPHKMSATKADAMAEKDIHEYYEKEIELDSEHRLYKSRREACNETMSLLMQLISIVKSDGSQSENKFIK